MEYLGSASGGVIVSQAWALRRMISTYNSITRRPHVPRERGLRQIMHDLGLGVDVDPPSVASTPAIADAPPGPPDSLGDDDGSDDSDSDTSTSGAPSTVNESDLSDEDHVSSFLSQQFAINMYGL